MKISQKTVRIEYLKFNQQRKKFMGIFDLVILGFALAMDAFAVSICKGFAIKNLKIKHFFIVAAYFGGFQALMPALGYFVVASFTNFIKEIDHWIAFVLLAFVGAKMIKESFENDSCKNTSAQLHFKQMLALALATSIDALAVGVSFGFVEFRGLNIYQAILIIGLITFLLCAFGLKLGNLLSQNSPFGTNLCQKAELVGGVILIGLGIKILIEHLLG